MKFILFFTFALVCFPSAPAFAAICEVPDSKYATIQSAINDTSCHIINVKPGTYYENLTIDRDVAIRGKMSKELFPRRMPKPFDANITAGSARLAKSVIIDGGGTGTVVLIKDNASSVRLKNLTIQNGYSSGSQGAGLSNGYYKSSSDSSWGAETTLKFVVVKGNTNDTSSNGCGGGIYSVSQMKIEDSSIKNNISQYGAGICTSAELAIERSSITSNDATSSGAGMYVVKKYTSVFASTFANNKAGANGGAIKFDDGNLYLVQVSLINNTAKGTGGAIYSGDSDGGYYTRTLFAHNSPDNCDHTKGKQNFSGEDYNLDTDGSCDFDEDSGSFSNHPIESSMFVKKQSGIQTYYQHIYKNSVLTDAATSVTDSYLDQIRQSGPLDGDGDGNAYWDIGAVEHDGSSTVSIP